MNLLFRMTWIWWKLLRSDPLPIGQAESRLILRTLPNDLDVQLHTNNGRYLTVCDLSRLDLFIRTGLVAAMRREGWAPLIAEHTMTYRRPLRLFQRFEAVLRLTHWDERAFYMTHKFHSRGHLIAHGTSVGGLRGSAGVVPPEVVLNRLLALRARR